MLGLRAHVPQSGAQLHEVAECSRPVAPNT